MSDTPRTDAAIKASRGQWSFVLRDLCRELERELEQERQDRRQADPDHDSHDETTYHELP
jgi:hypothetical protein